MKITLDEIIEFTDSNGYEIIEEAWNGILYRGSDGEEVYEDEIIEMIEEKKKKAEKSTSKKCDYYTGFYRVFLALFTGDL